MINYEIYGQYQTCSWEWLDETTDKQEALQLLNEYRIAFGIEWKIKIIKTKK